MIRKSFWKVPLFMAVCMAFALVLAGCDGTGSGASNNNGNNGNGTTTPVTFTVTFNTHGGSPVAAQEVPQGTTATRPTTNPTRSGYTFTDWFTAETGGSVFDFATLITADTIIHAQWQQNNEFTFGEVTTPLNFAAFSTGWGATPYEPPQNGGFVFFLSKTEGINFSSNVISIDLPFELMGQDIDLSEEFHGAGGAGWRWILIFISGEGDIYESRSFPSETTTGTMRVDRTDTYTFKITIDTELGGKPFSAHFYGEFEHKTHDEIVFD